ncbi:MAG TPA: hypothetical protein VGH28_02900 [Polyangiaceae bacterium]
MREQLLWWCDGVQDVFRVQERSARRDLYLWHPEDYCFHLIEPGDPPGDIPVVS